MPIGAAAMLAKENSHRYPGGVGITPKYASSPGTNAKITAAINVHLLMEGN
jgi:hypothetical protein